MVMAILVSITINRYTEGCVGAFVVLWLEGCEDRLWRVAPAPPARTVRGCMLIKVAEKTEM